MPQPWEIGGSSPVDDIRAHLARLLASDAFPASSRRRNLLDYVVKETLAGRGDHLKAYDLAVSVLGRDASFNPQTDPIVRIEMGRLRRDLDHFYANHGQAEPFRIAIPKGRYLAAWEASEEPASSTPATRPTNPMAPGVQGSGIAVSAPILAPAAPTPMRSAHNRLARPAWPRVLVQPFRHGVGDASQSLAISLTEGLIADLMGFDCLEIYTGRPDGTLGDAAWAGDAGLTFVLNGIVEHERDHVRATARLTDHGTGQVVWCDRFERPLTAGYFHLTAELTAAIAGRLAPAYGVIHQTARRHLGGTRSPDDRWFACATVQRAFDFRRTFTRSAYPQVRADLELASRHHPECAATHAMRAFALLDAARFGIVDPGRKLDELQAGLQLAQLAVELAPESALALQALAALRYTIGDVDEAERVQRRAVARNSNDPEGLAQLGWRLLARGRWKEGNDLMEQAIARSLVVPSWYHMVLALARFLTGDAAAARAEAGLGKDYEMGPGYATLALIEAEAGHKEAARTALTEALRCSELLRRDPVAYWQTFQVVPEVIERFNGGLARAGL